MGEKVSGIVKVDVLCSEGGVDKHARGSLHITRCARSA
jgi:hypothetical protein